MSGSEILTYIISIMVGGIKGIGQGIGEGISSVVNSLMMQTVGDVTSFSVFGNFILVFAAIALGFSLGRWVLQFLTSFGNRNQ